MHIVVKINEKQVVNWTQSADWNGGSEGPGRRITGAGTIALQAHDAKDSARDAQRQSPPS
jgi:hypothetical protein